MNGRTLDIYGIAQRRKEKVAMLDFVHREFGGRSITRAFLDEANAAIADLYREMYDRPCPLTIDENPEKLRTGTIHLTDDRDQ